MASDMIVRTARMRFTHSMRSMRGGFICWVHETLKEVVCVRSMRWGFSFRNRGPLQKGPYARQRRTHLRGDRLRAYPVTELNGAVK
jgi:hypothetical protein